MMQVPALVFRAAGVEQTLIQSVPIIEYLNERVPEPALLPSDPLERAKCRAIVETIASGIQPLQNLESYKLVEPDPADWGKFARKVITQKFAALERLLARHAGEYTFGDRLSMADVLLEPQVYNARRYGVDLQPFPTISRLSAKLIQLPAFDQSRPERQPDCPAEMRI